MIKIYNRLLFFNKKITNHKDSHDQSVFCASLIFYYRYSICQNTKTFDLSKKDKCILYGACIFLAHKSMNALISVNKISSFIKSYIDKKIPEIKISLEELNESIFVKEFEILCCTGFKNVYLPYEYIKIFKIYLENLIKNKNKKCLIDDEEKKNKLVKLLNYYINDTFTFPLFLYFTPIEIFISCICLIKEQYKTEFIDINDLFHKIQNIIDINLEIDQNSIDECCFVIKKIKKALSTFKNETNSYDNHNIGNGTSDIKINFITKAIPLINTNTNTNNNDNSN